MPAADAGEKPVVCAFLSAKGAPASLRSAAPVPFFSSPEAAARALGLRGRRGDWLRRPAGTIPELDVDREAAADVVAEALARGDDAWLAPARRAGCSRRTGFPSLPECVVDTADDAAAAATELGFPVVVKSAAAGAHKTESGGVALEPRRRGGSARSRRSDRPAVLLQPMIRGGAELLAGAVQDPIFGPLVAFGLGGVLAELIGQARSGSPR